MLKGYLQMGTLEEVNRLELFTLFISLLGSLSYRSWQVLSLSLPLFIIALNI
jgi:hypothetical protein